LLRGTTASFTATAQPLLSSTRLATIMSTVVPSATLLDAPLTTMGTGIGVAAAVMRTPRRA
jgi:hypothetical protein